MVCLSVRTFVSLHMCVCVCVPVFLIRSYGAPNAAGRCSVSQCYDNTLEHVGIKLN